MEWQPCTMLLKTSVLLPTDMIFISQRFFPCCVEVFVDETDDTKELLLMKMATPTSVLLPSEIPQCSPDIMQVMLLTLRVAYTRKMCSIDRVTC